MGVGDDDGRAADVGKGRRRVRADSYSRRRASWLYGNVRWIDVANRSCFDIPCENLDALDLPLLL